jgi:hypothetical protein
VLRLPRSHEYTSFSVSLFSCWTKVWTAVKNAATVTPARIKVAAVCSPRSDVPIRYAAPTARTAPAKAASGRTYRCPDPGPYAIASVAPSPAPAATPSR